MEHPRKSASKWERSKNAGRRLQFAKKYTVSGLVYRDSHVASPLERFSHSLFEYNSRFLRATNYQQRATAFSMEAPQGKSAINRYQLKEQHLLHRYKEPCQNYDLMGIIFVYLGNSKVKDQLINLLDLMFKSSKNASEKITTLYNDFGIDLTQEGEGDLKLMCNLGEGIYEDGLMKGKKEGKIEGKLELALELLKDGMSLEKVAKYSKLSLSMIKELAKQNKLI